jgi:hypothetical protein
MDAMGDQRGDNPQTLVPPPNHVENFCDEFGTVSGAARYRLEALCDIGAAAK